MEICSSRPSQAYLAKDIDIDIDIEVTNVSNELSTEQRNKNCMSSAAVLKSYGFRDN
jgi:hypothetical protein